jgi:ketosteroid isomerase-like protein
MPASLEVVKIALQAYGNGDCEIALALADPLIRWDERASRIDGDLVWKHDAVERAMRRYLDSWEEYRFDLEDVAEVGPGTVVGICRERGKPKDDDATIDRRFGGLWVVEHSKIVSWTTYLTPKEAVRAAKELVRGRVQKGEEKRADEVTHTEGQAPAAASPEATADEKPTAEPEPTAEPQPAERRRKRFFTKSDEQKRAARARAKLRRRSSRKTA